jgi:hypothetical protein
MSEIANLLWELAIALMGTTGAIALVQKVHSVIAYVLASAFAVMVVSFILRTIVATRPELRIEVENGNVEFDKQEHQYVVRLDIDARTTKSTTIKRGQQLLYVKEKRRRHSYYGDLPDGGAYITLEEGFKRLPMKYTTGFSELQWERVGLKGKVTGKVIFGKSKSRWFPILERRQ